MTKGVRALKKYRFNNDLTQVEFCEKFNFNRNTIACIESGVNVPSIPNAKILAGIIGINWSLFYEEEGE